MDPTDRQEVLQGPHMWDSLSPRVIVRFSTLHVLHQQLWHINGLLPYRPWANHIHSASAVIFVLS